MLKICILDTKTLGTDIDLTIFSKFGEVSAYPTTSPEEVVARIKDIEVIITNKVVLNESNLKAAAGLKLICITATGTNNVDLDYASSRGIVVTNAAGYSTNSVAQHTFAMLFYLMSSMPYYDGYVKSKEYAASDIFTHLEKPFGELNGKTWGIIGLGAIGRTVASIAKAFGCNVVYYSTSGKNDNPEHKRLSIEELLQASDIISIHSPLNASTQNLLAYQQLKMMKPSALLLNLGRGGIVNEKDLACAIDEGLLGGAALDVLEKEPVQDTNPLLNIVNKDRLLITPHIAWASTESRLRLVNEVMLNIESFIKGESRNRVC